MNIRFGIFMLTFMYSCHVAAAEGEELDKATTATAGMSPTTAPTTAAQRTDGGAPDDRSRKVPAAGKRRLGRRVSPRTWGGRRRGRSASAFARIWSESGRRQPLEKLENQEKDAAQDLQRAYRGHLARKATRRWAMKQAELWV